MMKRKGSGPHEYTRRAGPIASSAQGNAPDIFQEALFIPGESSSSSGRTIAASTTRFVEAETDRAYQLSSASFFPSSSAFEVSGGHFSSYRDHHTSGNVIINVNQSGNEESVEIRRTGPTLNSNTGSDEQMRRLGESGYQNTISRSPEPIPRDNADRDHDSDERTQRRHPSSVNQPHTSSLPVQKSSEIYYRHLLTPGRGSPLWIPEPSNTLPTEYQTKGISIGDIGILTDYGSFDFLFNIYLPKGEPGNPQAINPEEMPEGFSPLRKPQARDISSHAEYKNDSFLASSLVKTRRDGELPGLIFESSALEGAILAMPNGANSRHLNNTTNLRRYARANAEKWYRYANSEVCGRNARNEDLRLVIGYTSTTTWGMATFANRSEQTALNFLRFKATGSANNGLGPAYGWEYSGKAEVKSGPDAHEIEKLRNLDRLAGEEGLVSYENQCLFVRTINVTLQDDVWDKLTTEWAMSDLEGDDETRSTSNQDSQSSFGASNTGGSSSGSTSTGLGTQGGVSGTTTLGDDLGAHSTRRKRPRRSVHLSEFPLPLDLHPSKTINAFLLRQKPDAKMAITEDNDWISVLEKCDEVFPAPDVLLSRIKAMYDICEQEDAVFLQLKNPQNLREKSQTSSNLPIILGTALNFSADGHAIIQSLSPTQAYVETPEKSQEQQKATKGKEKQLTLTKLRKKMDHTPKKEPMSMVAGHDKPFTSESKTAEMQHDSNISVESLSNFFQHADDLEEHYYNSMPWAPPRFDDGAWLRSQRVEYVSDFNWLERPSGQNEYISASAFDMSNNNNFDTTLLNPYGHHHTPTGLIPTLMPPSMPDIFNMSTPSLTPASTSSASDSISISDTPEGILYSHSDQLRMFRETFSLPADGAGPFLPQKMYKQHTTSDRKRYVEEVMLEGPIYFVSEHPQQYGILLKDALHSRTKKLRDRDRVVFEGRGPSVSIRLEWPGYRQWSRQIPTKDFRSPPQPITLAKLAKNVAKCVQRFIQDHKSFPMEEEADQRWKVGDGPDDIKLQDLLLVSIHHVALGSWQPHLRLASALPGPLTIATGI